jgi:hypothetical protein
MIEINVGNKLTFSEIQALSELDATKLLISFIITFLFWFVLAIALLVLFHIRSNEMTVYLLSLEKVFSILGLSVAGLTVLTWRIVLIFVCKYYKWYVGKYTNIS